MTGKLRPIEVRHGDLLALERGIIVHGCNAQGRMGSGVALAIRNKWPEVYERYCDWHARSGSGELQLGSLQLVPVAFDEANPQAPSRVVANAITQRFYGNDGRRYVDYEAISRVFGKLAQWSQKLGLPLHFPLIGCGLAGGEWSEVSARIEAAAPNVEKVLWLLPGTELPRQ